MVPRNSSKSPSYQRPRFLSKLSCCTVLLVFFRLCFIRLLVFFIFVSDFVLCFCFVSRALSLLAGCRAVAVLTACLLQAFGDQLDKFPDWVKSRLAAMAPTGPVARMLASHSVVMKVGEWVWEGSRKGEDG